MCEDAKQKENVSTQIDLFLNKIEEDYHAMVIKLENVTANWT